MNFLKNLFKKKPKVDMIDLPKRFDLIGRVGQGSMSKVWRARDTRTGQMVAVKVLDKKKTLRFESRFLGLNKPSEGEVATQLQHPNIVRTLEFGWTTEKEQFLVMEFVEGVSLSFLVDMQNEVMQQNRLKFMVQLGEAIEHFHKQNWIHRDICPRNVLVDEDQQVKLIDFGLVVPNISDFQKPGNRTGTANYMAPELIKRQNTDQRIDIFSYAVTCYEMYTKQMPWDADETLDMIIQHINQPPNDIRKFVQDLDEDVAETIMRGLKQFPADRWQNIGDMVERFRTADERIPASSPASKRDKRKKANSPKPKRQKAESVKGETRKVKSTKPKSTAGQQVNDTALKTGTPKGKTGDAKKPKPSKSQSRASQSRKSEVLDSEDLAFEALSSERIESEPTESESVDSERLEYESAETEPLDPEELADDDRADDDRVDEDLESESVEFETLESEDVESIDAETEDLELASEENAASANVESVEDSAAEELLKPDDKHPDDEQPDDKQPGNEQLDDIAAGDTTSEDDIKAEEDTTSEDDIEAEENDAEGLDLEESESKNQEPDA